MRPDTFVAEDRSEHATSKLYHTAVVPLSRGALGACKGKAKPQGFPLPQELLDVIIDWLKDDLSSLRNCALVAGAWRRRSQLHIHRTLKVSSRHSCQRAERLYSDTFLASCIREIEILDLHFDHDAPHDRWLDSTVPAMLSTLNHAHPLTISAVTLMNGHNIDWARYPEPLFPHVTKLNVTLLEFNVASEFATFMRHFPRLTSLSLGAFIIEYTTRDVEAPGPRPPLRKLDIRSGPGQEFFMNWFLHQPAENIQLETLTYPVERWQLRAPRPSLRALGASVKNITIVFPFESPHYLLKGDPILPCLSSVRNITFDLATLYGSLYGPPSFPVLLRELPTTARVSSLRFVFTLDTYPVPLHSAVEMLKRVKLAQTNASLCELQPFSKLQELLIQVRSDDWARFQKLQSVDAWIASAEPKQTEERPCTPSQESLDWWGIPTLDQLLKKPPEVRTNIHRLRAEYEMVHKTWQEATDVFQKAFPAMAACEILRVEPLADGSSERVRCEPKTHTARGPWQFPYVYLYRY